MDSDTIRKLLAEATPGPWYSEEKPGMKAMGQPSSIGVWSEHKFNAALVSDDEDIDPKDEAWIAGIWGILCDEDRANAGLIAAAPDLAAEVLRLREDAMQSIADGAQAQEALDRAIAAEAERDRLRALLDEAKEALEAVASRAPAEEPPPAYDSYGWQIADTPERHAERVSDIIVWAIANIARAALAKIGGQHE